MHNSLNTFYVFVASLHHYQEQLSRGEEQHRGPRTKLPRAEMTPKKRELGDLNAIWPEQQGYFDMIMGGRGCAVAKIICVSISNILIVDLSKYFLMRHCFKIFIRDNGEDREDDFYFIGNFSLPVRLLRWP